jgi:subtilisin family serine protease
LAKSHGIQYRVINQKRNIIEYVGLSEAELKELIPKSKFISNKIYDVPLIKNSTEVTAQSIGDKPYYGPHTPVYRTASTAQYFAHLKQIDAENLGNFQGQGVTIAIIDTGVYYNHPHLSPNIKINTNEQSTNGVDNDSNGLIDDYVGWDFYNGDAFPIDDNGHGTHVAGLAASTFSGIAPKAKILPIKVLGANGSGDLATIAQGILYAIDQGADIINLSLGGSVPTLSSDLQQLINSVQFAQTNDALIIAASGNGGSDGVGDCNDGAPIYPANIDSNNVVSVAAVNRYNQITNYSNYGVKTVDIAAPGGDQFTGALLSTGIPNCSGPCETSDTTYVENIGTSMATPIVSGIAALIKSKNLSRSFSQVKSILEQSIDFHSALEDKVKVSGVVNATKALSY